MSFSLPFLSRDAHIPSAVFFFASTFQLRRPPSPSICISASIRVINPPFTSVALFIVDAGLLWIETKGIDHGKLQYAGLVMKKVMKMEATSIFLDIVNGVGYL
ncbi:unnamed protein product [Vicia faba]|uniref:Uncharacterized protein n=1 Tax=Vicia faba TaxID=3906 RepID=A0AAV1BCB8_VICFA|nr:unnamed protein product [Vicia faba]